MEEESLVWIAKWEGRELKGYHGYFLLRLQFLQSWKDLKKKLPSPFLSLPFPPIQKRAISLLFLLPSFPFPSFPFPSFLFSLKLLSKYSRSICNIMCKNGSGCQLVTTTRSFWQVCGYLCSISMVERLHRVLECIKCFFSPLV